VAPTTAGQYYIYDSTTGTLYYDADSTGATAPLVVCILVGKPHLTYQDVLAVLGA
jgi:hypothetical protein